MLKINNIKFKKCRIPLLLIMISLGGVFLYQYLTFIPEYSSATEISTEKPDKTLTDITYMQEMTNNICQRSSENESNRLIDKRDGKYYWVSKLDDGRCWMTQNLDLDLNNITLTNNNSNYEGSDVLSSWTPNLVSELWSDTGPNTVKYYDPGYKLFFPDDSVHTVNENLAYGKDDANYNEDDAHYLIGNYYSFNSATAGSGEKINSGNAEYSICPTGWMLPTSNNSNPGSFGGLGLTIKNVTVAPYYFVEGGVVAHGGAAAGNTSGYYWSSTVYTATIAYSLYLRTDQAGGVYPSNTFSNQYRYFGFSIRCVNNPKINGTSISEPNNPTLSVTIPNIITLDVYSDPEDKKNNIVNIATNTNDISTGTFITEVSSNSNYSITLNAMSEGSEGTSLIGKKDNGELNGHSIPTLTTNTDASGNTTYIQPQKGISSWGIRTCTSMLISSCNTEQYKPLPSKNTSTTPNPFYTGTPGSNQSTLFQIGIGISPNLPSGTYSTQIQVTASSTGSN